MHLIWDASFWQLCYLNLRWAISVVLTSSPHLTAFSWNISAPSSSDLSKYKLNILCICCRWAHSGQTCGLKAYMQVACFGLWVYFTQNKKAEERPHKCTACTVCSVTVGRRHVLQNTDVKLLLMVHTAAHSKLGPSLRKQSILLTAPYSRSHTCSWQMHVSTPAHI